jgi:hypothetical protein
MTAAVALAVVADPMAGEPHHHSVRWQAEGVGGDLRHDCIGTVADVVRGGFDQRRTVAVQRHCAIPGHRQCV